jgi:hypothetical protein
LKEGRERERKGEKGGGGKRENNSSNKETKKTNNNNNKGIGKASEANRRNDTIRVKERGWSTFAANLAL